MKKLLSFMIISIISAGFITSCQQESFTSPFKIENQELSSNTDHAMSLKIENNSPESDAECDCPAGYSKCHTICFFSDCCICCPPGNACAAGCYYGIAMCKCGDDGIESSSHSSIQLRRH